MQITPLSSAMCEQENLKLIAIRLAIDHSSELLALRYEAFGIMKIYDVGFPIKVAQTTSKVYSSFRITPTQHIYAIAYKVIGRIATAA